jgi:hypothetical protein
MDTKNSLFLAGSLIIIIVFGLNIWGNGSQLFYDRYKDEELPWITLQWLRISRTRDNCILFIKVISGLGFFLLMMTMLFLLLFQLRNAGLVT